MTEISQDVAPAAVERTAAKSVSDRAMFMSLIAAATVLPILFVCFAAPTRESTGSVDDVFRLLMVLSTMHVGLTGYFYFDREYRAHAFQHAPFYILLPLLVIVGAGALTALYAAAGLLYLQIFYHAWLLFHYGRQNYGILAFTSIATQSGRPSALERLSLHLAPIGGILGAHAVYGAFRQSVLGPWLEWSLWIGIGLTVLAIVLAAAAAVLAIMKRASLWRPFMILMLSLFYVPTFFFDNYLQAVMSYAIAHALQYFVFMVFLAAGAPQRNAGRSVLVLACAALATWGLILLTREPAIWGPAEPFITGAALGIVMWHFILDAGFWRLSQPWQRARVQERFGFLFER